MNELEIARIIEEQHQIRAARFETGPHPNDQMKGDVEGMLHLNDYLHDYAIGGASALPHREATIPDRTRREDRTRVNTETAATRQTRRSQVLPMPKVQGLPPREEGEGR